MIQSILLPALVFICIKYHVYKNYSSMLMLSVLFIHYLDRLAGAIFRIGDFAFDQGDEVRARYSQRLFGIFIFSYLLSLLLLQWY